MNGFARRYARGERILSGRFPSARMYRRKGIFSLSSEKLLSSMRGLVFGFYGKSIGGSIAKQGLKKENG